MGIVLVLLDVRELTCFRQNRCLFADLSFQLQPGQLFQVKGANGAGKSTLLRTILGLFRQEEGGIFWQQQPTYDCSEQFYDDVLYLGHKFAINNDLTPAQNLAYWSELNLTHNEDFESALAQVGLASVLDVPCHSLSAGQHRRVALARMWLSSAKLWILDEPFTAIDHDGVALIQSKFHQHLESGGMILLTSHQDLSAPFLNYLSINLSEFGELE